VMEHLAVVTGASSGIGFELARCAVRMDHDLIIAADEPEIETAADAMLTGWMNKLQSAIANITPAEMLAERHRRRAQPGSARR
jgi:uncharacterized protein